MFYTSTKSTPADLPKYKYVQVMKQANNITYFAELLSSTDFGSLFSHECPNDAYNTLCDICTHLFDVAFPIKIIRLAGRYIKREDWVTQGIIKYSITKSKLLRKKTHNPSVQNITKFKKYWKLFTKIKRLAKAKYYTEIFEYNVNDMKRTWQILRKAINKQPIKSNITDTFIVGNNEITDKRKIANGFNNFFANIGTQFVSHSMNLLIILLKTIPLTFL